MPIYNLAKIFAPQRIAVIGASPDAASVGHTVLANIRGGFKGSVYAVNPKYQQIDGTPCFQSVRELPEPVIRAEGA